MARLCSVEGCGKVHLSLGYCRAHYGRYKRYGDPLAGGVTPKPRGVPCEVAGCEKPTVQHGRCAMHNSRLRRHGSVHGGKFVQGEQLGWLRDRATNVGDECLLWPYAIDPTGYGVVHFRGRKDGAHRVMCILTNGEPVSGDLEAAHSCGVRSCVNPKHLRWATSRENSLEKRDHGTMLIGERNHQHVLTPDKVQRIRAMEGKVVLRVAAEQFGISIATVHRIWRREAWAWLDD